MPFLERKPRLALACTRESSVSGTYIIRSLPKTHPRPHPHLHTLRGVFFFSEIVCVMYIHLWISSQTNVSNCLPRSATRRHATCNMRQLAPLQRRWKKHPAGAMEKGKERCANLSGAKHGTRNRMTDDTISVVFFKLILAQHSILRQSVLFCMHVCRASRCFR